MTRGTIGRSGVVDEFDSAEANHASAEKVEDGLSHLIGSKDEDVRLLPDLSETDPISKEARRDFSEREKYALIEEDGAASNARKIDVKGTHYENQSAAEIAMMILPLKGF